MSTGPNYRQSYKVKNGVIQFSKETKYKRYTKCRDVEELSPSAFYLFIKGAAVAYEFISLISSSVGSGSSRFAISYYIYRLLPPPPASLAT